jgi:hypothetical protein
MRGFERIVPHDPVAAVPLTETLSEERAEPPWRRSVKVQRFPERYYGDASSE